MVCSSNQRVASLARDELTERLKRSARHFLFFVARGLSISLLASDALLYGGLMNVDIPRPQYGAIYCS